MFVQNKLNHTEKENEDFAETISAAERVSVLAMWHAVVCVQATEHRCLSTLKRFLNSLRCLAGCTRFHLRPFVFSGRRFSTAEVLRETDKPQPLGSVCVQSRLDSPHLRLVFFFFFFFK